MRAPLKTLLAGVIQATPPKLRRRRSEPLNSTPLSSAIHHARISRPRTETWAQSKRFDSSAYSSLSLFLNPRAGQSEVRSFRHDARVFLASFSSSVFCFFFLFFLIGRIGVSAHEATPYRLLIAAWRDGSARTKTKRKRNYRIPASKLGATG